MEGRGKGLYEMSIIGPHRTPFHHLKVEKDEVTLFSLTELEDFC